MKGGNGVPDHYEAHDIIEQGGTDEHDAHPRLRKVKARGGAAHDDEGRAERCR